MGSFSMTYGTFDGTVEKWKFEKWSHFMLHI